MTKAKIRILIWLDWPVACFNVTKDDVKVLEDLVGKNARMDIVRSERAFLANLPEAGCAICWEFDKAWFPRAKKLKLLATPGAGRELLPSDSELPPGVKRVNGDFHGPIIAETVVGYLFAHARGLYAAYDFQREDRNPWPRGEMSPYCTRVEGTEAVILGYGNVGRAIGARLAGLGVRVRGISRTPAERGDPALARKGVRRRVKAAVRNADWLILALPSDTGTDNIVDADILGAMKRTAVLVNVGRGNAVNEADLAEALSERRIAAAFLDVFAHEPLDGSSPLAARLPGLYRFPHSSCFAPDYLKTFFGGLGNEIARTFFS